MKQNLTIMILGIFLFSYGLSQKSIPGAFSITRIHYNGGGDWYSDPSSLPNLLEFLSYHTNTVVNLTEKRAEIGDEVFYSSPYLYLTGHGNIKFSDKEVQILREHLLNGAFLHADDNFGMDKTFRREMKKVFPDKDWVELPVNHEIFHTVYDFPNGLPKVHEHDGNRPQALGLFHKNELIVIYTFESDLGDGWEDASVHDDSPAIQRSALEMGVNIILYALSQ
jgi:hypothetical protein